MTEAERLNSYTHGEGPYHDEIAIGVEALMRRHIANALRIAPGDVVFSKHGVSLRGVTTMAQRTFDDAMAERIAAIHNAEQEAAEVEGV